MRKKVCIYICIHIYTHTCATLLYRRNWHDIGNQLRFNKKNKEVHWNVEASCSRGSSQAPVTGCLWGVNSVVKISRTHQLQRSRNCRQSIHVATRAHLSHHLLATDLERWAPCFQPVVHLGWFITPVKGMLCDFRDQIVKGAKFSPDSLGTLASGGLGDYANQLLLLKPPRWEEPKLTHADCDPMTCLETRWSERCLARPGCSSCSHHLTSTAGEAGARTTQSSPSWTPNPQKPWKISHWVWGRSFFQRMTDPKSFIFTLSPCPYPLTQSF